MAEEKPDERKDDDKPAETHKRIDVPRRGDVTVEMTDAPPRSPQKTIHRRRPAPPVPDSKRKPKGD